MIEKIRPECIYNPKLDCPDKCVFYSANVEAVRNGAPENKMSHIEYVAEMKNAFSSLSPSTQVNIMTKRVLASIERGIDPNECYQRNLQRQE